MITFGLPVVYGVPEKQLPLDGFPVGKYRLRFRAEEFALIFVKTSSGIRKYYLRESRGKWIPGLEIAANEHGEIQKPSDLPNS